MTEEEIAKCRGCDKILRGRPYRYGGSAYDPITKSECKKNYYGGFVCSRSCDFNSSLELERSMPGHSYRDRDIGCYAKKHFNSNWENEEV